MLEPLIWLSPQTFKYMVPLNICIYNKKTFPSKSIMLITNSTFSLIFSFFFFRLTDTKNVIMAHVSHMYLFSFKKQMINNWGLSEHKNWGNPASLFTRTTRVSLLFAWGWKEGWRRGCSPLSPPLCLTKKKEKEKTLDQPLFHSHRSYYGILLLRDICSANNNGARPRVPATDPLSRCVPSSSCRLPRRSVLSPRHLR